MRPSGVDQQPLDVLRHQLRVGLDHLGGDGATIGAAKLVPSTCL
jgi:hypothetical protein